ncbi:MAG: hypothetical protein JXB62_15105 [Pirellulales bacterium]|nr:hypothetical protein [Pirellulales bacterium]
MPKQKRVLTAWLQSAPPPAFAGYAIVASFSVYFFMFAFRKPFAAAQYEGLSFLGTKVDLKTALVIGQVLGYGLCKYAGIKFCSEIGRATRANALVLLILLAEAAWLLFGVLPNDWKVVAVFLNGFPLGMIWGLIVWYLEGRRTSELLLAGMSCSYIVASGLFKDIGLVMMTTFDMPEPWMPAVTGLCFLPAYLLAVWMLNQLPEPDLQDVAARVRREPMTAAERLAFVKRFLPGLLLLLVVYFFLNAYREYRDNFGREMFLELGYDGMPAMFTRAELVVAFGVMAALAALNLIQDNRRGLLGAFAIMACGTLLLGVSTLLLQLGHISGFSWMVAVGLGAYLAYVPFGSVLFDRLIASTRAIGTAVFAIYIADALGYTGTISVMLYSDLAQGDVSRLDFFRGLTCFMSALGTLLLAAGCVYFFVKSRASTPPGEPPA